MYHRPARSGICQTESRGAESNGSCPYVANGCGTQQCRNLLEVPSASVTSVHQPACTHGFCTHYARTAVSLTYRQFNKASVAADACMIRSALRRTPLAYQPTQGPALPAPCAHKGTIVTLRRRNPKVQVHQVGFTSILWAFSLPTSFLSVRLSRSSAIIAY